jgi:hypothetical protein
MKEIISPAGKAKPFRTVRRQSRRRLLVVSFADECRYFLYKQPSMYCRSTPAKKKNQVDSFARSEIGG